MHHHPLQDVLLSFSDDAEHSEERMLFGQFEGAWDLDVRWFENGDLVREEKGEWHFGWVLGGRAIQDVWIVPPQSEHTAVDGIYEYGTSVRFFDARAGAWQSTWIGPVQRTVRTFLARRRGDEIVLEGTFPDGRSIEWIFSQIESDRFLWRFQVRSGDDWDVVQSFVCTRRATGA